MCDTEGCGETRPAGRPPRGWYNLRRTGDKIPGRPMENRRADFNVLWFCSAECVIHALGGRVVTDKVPDNRLDDLNRLAGTSLTIMDATPHRVEVALRRAFARVIDQVEKQAKTDARGRPSTALLLAESGGDRVESKICTRCGAAKTLDEFSSAIIERTEGGWCRSCNNQSQKDQARLREGGGATPDPERVERSA